jgi:hypothetical protein
MKDIRNTSNKLVKILAYPLSMIFMFLLAYIDYITADYSLILFYVLIVVAATWYTNIVFGICSATLCAIVEAVSDYYVHHNAVFNPVYYWNWACNLIIYVTLATFIYYVKFKQHNRTI